MVFIRKLKLDVWVSLFLLITSGYLINITRVYPDSAAAFPKIILNTIVVLSVLSIVESLINTFKGRGNNNTSVSNNKSFINAFAIYAFIIIYFILLKPFGFIIATILFSMASSWFLGSKSLVKNISVGIGFNIFVYLAFVMFLNVPIPLLPAFL